MATPRDDDDAPKGHAKQVFEARVADETFSFTSIKFDAPIVTAAEVAGAVSADPGQSKVLQQLTSGEIETRRPTEQIDLRDRGVERFFVIRSDRTFAFRVGDLSLEWPLPTVHGKHLRELVRATDEQDLVRVTAQGFRPVEDDDQVTFEYAETEEFRLVDRPRTVTIFYREQAFEVERRAWTTEELMELFGVTAGYKLDLIEPDGEFKEMKPGHKVKVRDGMEFTSHVPAGQSS